MQDVMRGASMPRYELDLARIESNLGAPLGALLGALSQLACRLAPFSPWTAFEPLDIHLTYLFTAAQPERLPGTTVDVIPFLDTSVDTHRAGFVLEGSRGELSSCAVCMLTSEPRLAAKNLAGFLGRVAYAGAEALACNVTPDEWRELRTQRLTDDDFAASSEALLGLPGVKLVGPRRTSGALGALTRLLARKPSTEPATVGLARVRQLLRGKEPRAARSELVRQIQICVGIPDLVPRERWSELQVLIDALAPALPAAARDELERRGVQLRREPP